MNINVSIQYLIKILFIYLILLFLQVYLILFFYNTLLKNIFFKTGLLNHVRRAKKCHDEKYIAEIKSQQEATKIENAKLTGEYIECKTCRKMIKKKGMLNHWKKSKCSPDSIEVLDWTQNVNCQQRENRKKRYHDNSETLNTYQKERYHDNSEPLKSYQKDYQRKRYSESPDKKKHYQKERYHDNSEPLNTYQKERYHDNSETLNTYQKERYHDNSEPLKSYQKDYQKKQYAKHHSKQYKFDQRLEKFKFSIGEGKYYPCISCRKKFLQNLIELIELMSCNLKRNVKRTMKRITNFSKTNYLKSVAWKENITYVLIVMATCKRISYHHKIITMDCKLRSNQMFLNNCQTKKPP